jgi:hypothetical protein
MEAESEMSGKVAVGIPLTPALSRRERENDRQLEGGANQIRKSHHSSTPGLHYFNATSLQ